MQTYKNTDGKISIWNSQGMFIGTFPDMQSAKNFYEGCVVK